jgi:pyruvate dehydrogenase E1 component
VGAFATVKDRTRFRRSSSQDAVLRQGPAALLRPVMQRLPQIELATDREISTQMAFGKILDDLSKTDSELAARIVTTSPDVTGTTNLGPWVNRRKLFARAVADTFKTHNIPSTAKWEFTPDGQHIELGIAEMNLFLLWVRPACRIRCSASG